MYGKPPIIASCMADMNLAAVNAEDCEPENAVILPD